MAINIDKVYQRVLAIANKEQRGYITPQEFNLFANQAQMSIFEQYFYDINQFDKSRGNSTEYADIISLLEEKIAPFKTNDASATLPTTSQELLTKTDFLDGTYTGWTATNAGDISVVSNANNNFVSSVKMTNATADTTKLEESSIALSVSKRYIFSVKVSYAEDSVAVNPPMLFLEAYPNPYTGDKEGQVFMSAKAVSGETYKLEFEPSAIALTGDNPFVNHRVRFGIHETGSGGNVNIHFSEVSLKEVKTELSGDVELSPDIYKIGQVFYNNGVISRDVQEVSDSDLSLMKNTTLTKPTYKNPAFARTGSRTIDFEPQTLEPGSTVTYNYIRTPKKVKWTYNIVLGKALYNSSASDKQNFELHPSEETSLVNEILKLAGISMNQPGLAQATDVIEDKKVQQQKI